MASKESYAIFVILLSAIENIFNLPLDGQTSDIWPGIRVVGGGLTGKDREFIVIINIGEASKVIRYPLQKTALENRNVLRFSVEELQLAMLPY